MNTIQKTAIVETTKVIGLITGSVFVISAAIALLSLQTIATILMVYCLAVGVKMIYDIQLSRAEAKQEAKQEEIDAEIDRLHK
jgi:hypothetical protein